MSTHKLQAENRTLFGRKVRQLRNKGYIIGNVFGKKIESQAISMEKKAFETVYKEAGETGIIELLIDGKTHPVLIAEMQVHPVTDEILHVDLHEVDLKEKVTAKVAVELDGEAPAQKEGLGTLVQLLDEVEVEALPANLPEKIVADVSMIKDLETPIHVRDLKVDKDVTIVTDGELIVAKVEEVKEEVVEEVAPETTEEEKKDETSEQTEENKSEASEG
jgi:large subunit ribosomal protein L25